jgi:hypothetical protein
MWALTRAALPDRRVDPAEPGDQRGGFVAFVAALLVTGAVDAEQRRFLLAAVRDPRGTSAPCGGLTMCGIVGFAFRDRQRPADPATVRRMCDAIRHRGPDDEGVHVDGPVGLGMRRLSIIDLSGGHQPVFNEDGSVAIVFNGEIYNYRELREGLIARGHVMRTHSDTETIVHSTRRWASAASRSSAGCSASPSGTPSAARS